MTPRLKVNDTVIHRVYGRAVLQGYYFNPGDQPQARIRVFGERAPRRVWLHDLEKEPAPLARPELYVVT